MLCQSETNCMIAIQFNSSFITPKFIQICWMQGPIVHIIRQIQTHVSHSSNLQYFKFIQPFECVLFREGCIGKCNLLWCQL